MQSNFFETLHSLGGNVDASLSFNQQSNASLCRSTLETAQEKMEVLRKSAKSLISNHGKEITDLKTQLGRLQQQNLELSLTTSTLKNEIKDLASALEIERQKAEKNKANLKQYHEWKKLNPEKLVKDLSIANNKIDDQKQRLQTSTQKLQGDISKKAKELRAVEERLVASVGKQVGEGIVGKKGKLTHYVMEIQSKLDSRPADDKYAHGFIDDVDFHYEIMSSTGVSVHTGLTMWAVPIIPFSTELQSDWNREIERVIHTTAVNKLKETHPNVVAMIDEAKATSIDEMHNLNSLQLEVLKNADYTNLYELVSLTYESFAKTVLLIGETNDAANQIYDVIKAHGIALRVKHQLV